MIVEHEYYGDDKQKLITVTNEYIYKNYKISLNKQYYIHT